MKFINPNLNVNQYHQYNDFYFRKLLQDRVNGVLSFLNVPYKITNMIATEFSSFGPKINRIDFAGDSRKDGEEISVIIECQSRVPTEEDLERFFQYVSSIRFFKKRKIVLYILCTEEVDYTEKDIVLNDDSKFVMYVISLKDIEAKEIFKNIENKIKNNEQITDQDIASVQLIAYTKYTESRFEILKKARFLLEEITDYITATQDDIDSVLNFNDKLSIIYLFSVLSENMLDENERKKFVEETKMLLNPRERYYREEGMEKGMEKGIEIGKGEGSQDARVEIAQRLVDMGFSVDEAIEITVAKKEKFLNSK